MIRRAFTLRLKKGALAEYKRYHESVWPALEAEFARNGITQVTLFQRGRDVFLYSLINDEGAWERFWNTPVHRRWARLMEPLLNTREDGMVEAGSLEEIYHVENEAEARAKKTKSKPRKIVHSRGRAKTTQTGRTIPAGGRS